MARLSTRNGRSAGNCKTTDPWTRPFDPQRIGVDLDVFETRKRPFKDPRKINDVRGLPANVQRTQLVAMKYKIVPAKTQGIPGAVPRQSRRVTMSEVIARRFPCDFATRLRCS